MVMIVDSFTRFVFAVPVPDKTAINAGRAVLQSIGIFGAPITTRSDGGGEFVAYHVYSFSRPNVVTTNAVYLVSFRKISHLTQLLQQDGVVADYE